MKKSVLLFTFFGTILALQGAENTFIKLEESVITSENFETTVRDTAANVSIITGEEIEKKGAKDLVDALKAVPGINVTRYAGTIKFDIRGLNTMYSDRNALITLDGVPVLSQQIANLPMNLIERIEVIPGGGNILYGDKAIGGVINILTKNAKDEKNYGSIFAETGSHDKNRLALNYGTKITDKLLFDISYLKSDDGGWRDGEDFDNDSINIKTKYLLENGDIEYKYTFTEDKDIKGIAVPRFISDEDRENPGRLSRGKYKSQDHYLKYRKELTSNTEILLYGNYYEKNNEGYRSDSYYRSTDDLRKYIKAQVKNTYSNNNYFILGGDYLNEQSKPYSSSKDSVKDNYGLFAINKMNLDKFQFTQGVRYDKADYEFYWANVPSTIPTDKIGIKDTQTYENLALELSSNYLYSDTGSLYLSYNRGFRTPNAREITLTKDAEKIDSQVQDTIEIGMKDFIGNTFISASTFYKKTNDEIYSAIPLEFSTQGIGDMINYNIGTTERVGFEIYGEHYIDKLTIKSSVTYIKGKVIDGEFAGSEIPSVPNWKLVAGLKYDFTDNLGVEAEAIYYSESYDLDDLKNERAKDTGEYVTVDISSNYQITPSLLLTARIENLFDEEYDEYAGYWYNGAAGEEVRHYYPAVGRTFTIGATYKF